MNRKELPTPTTPIITDQGIFTTVWFLYFLWVDSRMADFERRLKDAEEKASIAASKATGME